MDGDHHDNNHGDDDDDDNDNDDSEKLDKPAKSPKESEAKFEDITDGLKELDMDHYDDEDEGILISLNSFFFLLLCRFFGKTWGRNLLVLCHIFQYYL